VQQILDGVEQAICYFFRVDLELAVGNCQLDAFDFLVSNTALRRRSNWPPCLALRRQAHIVVVAGVAGAAAFSAPRAVEVEAAGADGKPVVLFSVSLIFTAFPSQLGVRNSGI
jgi:hypothetical protein